MFGGRFFGKHRKPLSPYEQRAKDREDEYARLGLVTYDEQQRHEGRKVLLGQDYLDRDTGTWRDAEEYIRHSQPHQTFWDWFWE
jgi:hypothetical protein